MEEIKSENSPKNVWAWRIMNIEEENHSTVLIAFLDILGFSELSRTNPRDADAWAREFRETLIQYLSEIPVFGIPVTVDNRGLHNSYQAAEMYTTRIKLSIISDAVFIIVQASNRRDWPDVAIVDGVLTALVNSQSDLIRKGIPIRGSIEVGRVYEGPLEIETVEGWHLVGPAVTNAVRGEADQKWIGISFVRNLRHEVGAARMDDSLVYLEALIDYLKSRGLVSLWPVPTKSGLIDRWALTWPIADLPEVEKTLKCLVLCYDKLVDETVAAKYRSTHVYVKHLMDRVSEQKESWWI